jgi:predicted KAP-like P-loop ATPase
MKHISIKDQPIFKKEEDKLKISRYIDALSMFIQESDTPITIGLQGEWGTGKTSMMYLLREKLSSNNIATSWVNTWEFSMFRTVSETTPSILNGLLQSLKESCGDKWPKTEKAQDKIKKIGRFLGNLMNQVVVNQTGLDVKAAADDSQQGFSLLRTEIAEVKKDIAELIDQLIFSSQNTIQRVVFFVDDLDRINPALAVEILESLKNIFDIPNCIFILAIDYDVVIKGLESKFGKKTDENEREFRSFFDKIIQVPFSMPVGTYDIDNFLKEKLIGLGVILDNDRIDSYLNVVKCSVGYNPRSLKRFLNTFSLLNTIRKLEKEPLEDSLLMLFSLLGLQISYPRIFRFITQNPDFLSWNQAFAVKNGVDWIDRRRMGKGGLGILSIRFLS